jgi:hypothetical protein
VLPLHYFGTYRNQIMALPLKSKPGDRHEEADLKRASLLLFSEANLDVYYAPFHMFNSSERIPQRPNH